MKKNLLSLLALLMALTLLFTACSGSSSSKKTKKKASKLLNDVDDKFSFEEDDDDSEENKTEAPTATAAPAESYADGYNADKGVYVVNGVVVPIPSGYIDKQESGAVTRFIYSSGGSNIGINPINASRADFDSINEDVLVQAYEQNANISNVTVDDYDTDVIDGMDVKFASITADDVVAFDVYIYNGSNVLNICYNMTDDITESTKDAFVDSVKGIRSAG